MKRVEFQSLNGYLFLPNDPERGEVADYILEIPLPNSPELNGTDDAGLLTFSHRRFVEVLDDTTYVLMHLGYRGSLHIYGMDNTPHYGTIDFEPDAPKDPQETISPWVIVNQYEELTSYRLRLKVQERLGEEPEPRGEYRTRIMQLHADRDSCQTNDGWDRETH